MSKPKTPGESGNVTNITRWKPGQSGNPKGRPKKADCLTSLLKEEIERIDPEDAEGRTHKQLIVLATMTLAKRGNATALKEVWERMDGKTANKLEIQDSPNAILLAKALSRKELQELNERLQRAVND